MDPDVSVPNKHLYKMSPVLVYKLGRLGTNWGSVTKKKRGHKIEGLPKCWINPRGIPFYNMGLDGSAPNMDLYKMNPVFKTNSLQNDS